MSASQWRRSKHIREENMTTFLTRRAALLVAATCAATLGLSAIAEAQSSIKIGYAISRTGPSRRSVAPRSSSLVLESGWLSLLPSR